MNEVDNYGKSALHYACSSGGSLPIVKLLISEGCRIDGVDFEGKNALQYACDNGFDDIIQFLFDMTSN